MDDEEDRIGTTVLVPLLSVGPRVWNRLHAGDKWGWWSVC